MGVPVTTYEVEKYNPQFWGLMAKTYWFTCALIQDDGLPRRKLSQTKPEETQLSRRSSQFFCSCALPTSNSPPFTWVRLGCSRSFLWWCFFTKCYLNDYAFEYHGQLESLNRRVLMVEQWKLLTTRFLGLTPSRSYPQLARPTDSRTN